MSTALAAKRLEREITNPANKHRPVYMVLRQAGVGPEAATHALYEAGISPSSYNIECGRILPGVRAGIVRELGEAIWRGAVRQ